MEVRKIVYKSPEYETMVDLRYRILRKPFGIALVEKELLPDETNHLLGCFDGDALAGCLVLQPEQGGWIRLRQVAVEENRQGQGIGRTLLRETYALARQLGYLRIYCHARDTAVGFYDKDGWKIVGEPFQEVGITHYRMELSGF